MKKYVIMLAMVFTMCLNVFAEENEATNLVENEKYEFNINNRRLACVLEMSNDQMEMTNDIISEFERDMEFAKVMGTEESRNAVAANAIKKNTKHMRYALNDKQYKKYVTLLNLTLQNKGFDIEKITR